jgi:hypothetical protein
MEINVWAIAAATVTMFVVGAVWYMAVFSKLWGKIHGMDKYSEKEMKELSSKMGPWYGLQLFMTVLTAFVLTHFIALNPEVEYWKVAFFVWLGFVLPTQVSAVIFGGTEPRWMMKKIAVMSGEALVRLLIAAWVISLF